MVSNGFAKSLKRPGGLYTGMDELPPGVTAKRLHDGCLVAVRTVLGKYHRYRDAPEPVRR